MVSSGGGLIRAFGCSGLEIPDGDSRLAAARGSFSIRRSLFIRGPRFRITLNGASREARRFEYRAWRQVRGVSLAHPNNGMHPTADTHLVIYFQRCGAAGDAGR